MTKPRNSDNKHTLVTKHESEAIETKVVDGCGTIYALR
jgi:hypothetical protein